jgi:hypothetical protein
MVIWRAGANEATEINFSDMKLTINCQKEDIRCMLSLPLLSGASCSLGKPTPGALLAMIRKNVLRIDVVIDRPDIVEVFTICFEGADKTKTSLMIAWDNKKFICPSNTKTHNIR